MPGPPLPRACTLQAASASRGGQPRCRQAHAPVAAEHSAGVGAPCLQMGKDYKGDPSLGIKIAAGLTTGAIGIAVASPTDLVKVGAGGVERRVCMHV